GKWDGTVVIGASGAHSISSGTTRETACLRSVAGLVEKFGNARAAVGFDGSASLTFGVGAVALGAGTPLRDLIGGHLGMPRGGRAVVVRHAHSFPMSLVSALARRQHSWWLDRLVGSERYRTDAPLS